MKFKLLLLLILTVSCSNNITTYNKKTPYSAKGFAYIYNENDLKEKIIKGRLDNEIMQISQQNLRFGALIKVSNPRNNENVVLTNIKRVKYPNFYKILISKPVAEKLGLNINLPIIEITEIKKNKSFVAKKAKIYSEEKKISTKAPIDSVQISNISKDKSKKMKRNSDKIFIHIATFYSPDIAINLKKRIINELTQIDKNKLIVKKINSKKTQVILGPYTSVNSLKNDYIKIKNLGFEELDIFINE